MAKLSETFTYGGGSNTAPSLIPQLTKQNTPLKLSETFSDNDSSSNSKPKLSEIFSYDIDTGIKDRPALNPNPSQIPVITSNYGVDYKLDIPKSKQNILQKAASLVGLSASPSTTALDAMNRAKAEEKRRSQLATFDRDDTSEVLYSTPTATVTRKKLDMWLDPSYEMSDAERKQAKEYYNAKMKEVRKRGIENMWTGKNGYSSPEEEQELWLLGTKTSKAKQFAYGFFNEMPLAKTGQNVVANYVDKKTGTNEASDYLNKANKSFEDEGAYKVGKAASKMTQYATLNKSGLLDPITNGLGNALIPKLGEKLGGAIAGILSDEVADIALDTVPEMVENIRNGMSADEVRNEVFKNLGINLAYNVGGEAIPQVVKAIKNNFGKNITEETAEQIVKNANEIADTVTKEAVETANQTNAGKNLIMAEDTGLRKNTVDNVVDEVKAVPDNVVKASGYEQPAEDATKLTAEYNERGMSKHIVGEETPMKVADVSDEVKKMFKNEPDAYQVLKNKDTKALADEVYKSADKPIQIGEKVYTGNAESKFRSMLADKNPAALPLGHQIAKDYSKAGNHEMASLIYRDMGQALTEAGQFTQASIINMMKNDPLTAMQYAERELRNLNEEGAKRFGKKWKDFSLTEDEIKAFNNIKEGDEEAIKALYDQIGQRIAKDYPTTFMEKLLEGRKVAMLFNVRTNVRNFGANVPTLGLRWMSDRVEALGQNIAHLINPKFKVTQSVMGSGVNGRRLAKEVFESSRVQDLLNANVGKYELPSIKNNLMKDRQMFKGTAAAKWFDKFSGDAINKLAKFLDEKNIIKNDVNVKGGIQALNSKLYGKDNVQSVLETIRNTTYKALDLGDQPFVKENFIERLGSYINAQGIKSIDDVPEEAIQTAWEEAMKATYKDDSWAVHMLRGIKKSIEKAPGIGKPVSQAVIPFLQAPGNIAARMVDYSPIRGTKGIADIIKGATSKNEEVVRRGIEEVAKGLTGTGMILFGMRLKESGLITGDYSEDKDEKNFQKQSGFRPWALHIGDKYFTYDWAQPFAQNLMVGTLLQEAIDNSDKADDEIMKYVDAGYKGTKAAVNSWFNASPLQGLADLMKGSGYSSKPDIAQNLIDVGVGDFTGALIPSSVNAVAKTNDVTQRNAYDPSSPILNTFINQQKSKIPGLSETLPAKYDTWGNRINYADSTGEAFAQRFLIPGDYGTEKNDRINDEINRLYQSTNNNAVFPQTAPNKVGDTTLNNTQVSDYQRDMGKRSRALVETLVKTDMYKHLDDESRAELLSQLYGASKLITERNLFKKEVSDNSSYKKLINAYDEGGTQGMIDYLADVQQIKQFKKEAGQLRPDGSEKSLDKQELAVYLNSQGYSLEEINEWIEKGNFGKPYTQSEFNNVISKSRSWK